MEKLYEYQVYTEELGRTLGEDDQPAVDAIASGYDALCWGESSTLQQFNDLFTRLQRRRRIIPLVGANTAQSASQDSPSRST